MARIVVPGYPHHVTQRGNRRQQTFFDDADYIAYIELLAGLKPKAGADIWAYCLMPNHVHLVVVPEYEQSLAKLFGITHHRYAKRVNEAHDWRGHLWQARFHSFVMDETHVLAAVRYVELNPVRAGLCAHPQDWPWSSVHAHLRGIDDILVNVSPMRERISDWRCYLADENSAESLENLRQHTRTGHPAGERVFIEKLETLTGRRLKRRKPGPQRRGRGN